MLFRSPRPTGPPGPGGKPAVTAKEAEAVTVIFVERVGAYWSLGPTLKDVRAYLAAHGLGGRLSVRSLDDPKPPSAVAVRTADRVHTARAHGMRVMFGCQVESSLGITAAAHLAPLADYVDLDGHLLLAEDPYRGVTANGSTLTLPDSPGLGVTKA